MEHDRNNFSPLCRPDEAEGFDPRLIAQAARLAASLGFEPVPLRRRRDGWTVERQLVYLAMLATGSGNREAAARVGMTPQSAGRLLRRPDAAAFVRACDRALRIGEPRRVAERRNGGRRRKFFHPQGSRNNET